jgi:hypothetical protein
MVGVEAGREVWRHWHLLPNCGIAREVLVVVVKVAVVAARAAADSVKLLLFSAVGGGVDRRGSAVVGFGVTPRGDEERGMLLVQPLLGYC